VPLASLCSCGTAYGILETTRPLFYGHLYMAPLCGLASEAGLVDRVRFWFGGSAMFVEVYRAADLFVMPSTGEEFGIAFLEVMACGTPALSLAVGGVQDPLGGGNLGTAVCKSDFTAALCRALKGPKRRPEGLAGAIRARFGYGAFNIGIRAISSQILEPA
jgi:phosphatidylinositol alpha-1,6-mannosyltransferase